jgi:hypothetical protein
MAGTIAPVIKHQFFTDAGIIASGYLLFSYEAGTTTPLSCYQDADLLIPHTNPITLDAAGRATIFLAAASYKFSLALPTDTVPDSPVWTVDEVDSLAGISVNQDVVAVAGEAITALDAVYVSDGSGGLTAGRWYKADSTNAYSSSSAFLVGIAPASISIGETGTVRILGRVTGLSSLTAGSIYYADSTPGAIVASAPSNARIIGFADSTTTLLVSSSGSATTVVSGGSGDNGEQLIADTQMLIWAAGDAAAPSHYVLGGTTPTITRAGDGLGDTNRKYGPYCAKLTGAAGGAGTLLQYVLPAASFDSYWQGQSFSMGAWVKCSSPSSARLLIYDGIGTSNSSYHSGGGAWEWLTVTRTLDGAASELTMGFETAQSVVSYVSGMRGVRGGTVPAGPAPSPSVYGTIIFKKSGDCSAAEDFDGFMPSRPLIVKDVVLRILTAPTGANLVVDVKHWDGAASQTMFSSKPTITAAGNYGESQPDGTYRYRCFTGSQAATYTDGLMSVDIDSVGSTIAGANLTIFVRCLQYLRPLESFLGYNE